jgi:hypothetical protein
MKIVSLDRYAAFTLIAAINCLFVCKYFLRFAAPSTVWGLLGLYVICLALIGIAIEKAPNPYLGNAVQWAYVALICMAALCLLVLIPVTSLRVDRWSIITSFLDTFFDGRMPYLARSFDRNVPGPFPVYFVLMVPFYLIKEIGLFTVASLVLLFWIAYKTIRHGKDRMAMLLFVTASPVFAWEVLVRSTLWGNAVICLGYLLLFDRHKEVLPLKRLLLFGMLGGLVAATRGITAIPVIVYASHRFLRQKLFLRFLLYGATAGLTFLATLLPFFIWDPAGFQANNPMVVQAGFLGRPELALILILSCMAGILAVTLRSCLLTAGLILCLSVLRSHIGIASWASWYECLFASVCDISYYVFAIPFLAFSIWLDDGKVRTGLLTLSDRTLRTT